METLLWILGIILVLYFLHSGWDSSYNGMVERMNEETDAEREIREAREQREKETKQAKLEDALGRAKYALIEHPKYGTVTWAGKGRKPKWLTDYLEAGGALHEIEYPPKQVIETEHFVIKVNKQLDLTTGPQGDFEHKEGDVKGALWIEDDGTLYDYDGVYMVPMEVLLGLKAAGFNTQNMEDGHVNNDLA